MSATLDLSVSMHGWVCSACHQLYDAMWRPTEKEKAWRPPVTYMWPVDKPTFNFCPNCGASFKKDTEEYAEEIRSR